MEIKIQQVSLTYPGGKQALKDVSLHLSSPCLTGLLGPNGAGKSTFIKLLAGALLPDKGHILVNGIPLNQYQTQLKSQLGYLPQDFGLFKELTAAEFLDYMAALKGLSGRKAEVRLASSLAVPIWP